MEAAARKEKQDRFTLEGALKALKNDLVKNQILKLAMEDALKANASSLQIVSELLDLCEMFVEQVNKLIVTFKYPRFWGVQRVLPRGQPGTVPLRFNLPDRIRRTKRPISNPGQPQIGSSQQHNGDRQPRRQNHHIQNGGQYYNNNNRGRGGYRGGRGQGPRRGGPGDPNKAGLAPSQIGPNHPAPVS